MNPIPAHAPSGPGRDDVTLLLEALLHPESALDLSLPRWTLLVRTARAAELLGSLRFRLEEAGVLEHVPAEPARHLHGAWLEHRYRSRMALYTLDGVIRALGELAGEVVLLKGVAYLRQELPMSRGRAFDDVDVLVPAGVLAAAEARLGEAGWITEKPDPYDQHYYRAWSHELPPMRHPDLPMQLDLHHAILPPTGRARPDSARLLARAVAVPGTPWRVLGPADQVLHVAAHLVQDSDCTGKLRELLDLHGLVLAHHTSPGFWDELLQGAEAHRLGRCLWYALGLAAAWLQTPFASAAREALARHRPPAGLRQFMDRALARHLPPVPVDDLPQDADSWMRRLLVLRAAWLRMPPHLLAYHAGAKWLRTLGQRSKPSPAHEA